MEVKIEPRRSDERGGVACMPMRKNIPEGRKNWKLTKCPQCGRECWETPIITLMKTMVDSALCTECALRQGYGAHSKERIIPDVEAK